MATEVDRERFCEIVGINSSTLSRWIREGVVTPSQQSVSEKQYFTERSVLFARAVRLKQKQLHGQHSLDEVVKIVRGELEAAPYTNSPAGSPAPHGSTWREENAEKGVRPASKSG
jgi:hypothetical protein